MGAVDAEDMWPGARNEAERRFLDRMAELVLTNPLEPEALFDAWFYYPQLVMTLCICDPGDPCVLRTLRVDYDGCRIVAGNDPSHQITEEHMDSEDPDAFETDDGNSPEEFAELAFDWFCDQANRPIERHEWTGTDHGWYLWILADAERGLVARYSGRPDRPPDRIVRIRPPVPWVSPDEPPAAMST
jgi:hypothetical protein